MKAYAGASLALSLLLTACWQNDAQDANRAPVEVKVVAPVADPLSQQVTQKVHAQALKRQALSSKALEGAPTPKPNFLPGCSRLVAADLEGDGDDEIVCWNEGRLTFWDQTEENLNPVFSEHFDEGVMPGIPNRMTVADFTGDGDEEVFIGWGMSPTQPDVPITISQVDIIGESGGHRRNITVLARIKSPRPEVVGLAYEPFLGEIRLAYYDSRYFVTLQNIAINKSGWYLKSQDFRHRMASSWAFSVGGDGYAVGRPYGDKKLEPGDLMVVEKGKRAPVPTHMGVRAIAKAKGGATGRPALFFSDGWHYQYGKKAEGRLNYAQAQGDGSWKSQLVTTLPGQYEVSQIEAVDLNQDGQDEAIFAGTESIHLAVKDGDSWKINKLADGKVFTLAQLRPGQPWTLVVAGAPIQLLELHGVL